VRPRRFPPLFRRDGNRSRHPAPARSGPPYPVDVADPALIPLRREIAERIAHVCEGMDPTTFARLVDAMAIFRRRWGLGNGPRRSADGSRAAS
jgi:hypothetical protein